MLPVQAVSESEVDENENDTTAQEAYQTILTQWTDKANAAYLIFIPMILDRLQAPVRQATSC
jgi:hypothetical protein